MMIFEAARFIAFDAFRYFTIGEGVALMVISGVSVVDAWIYAWPKRLRIAIVLRWLGRFGMVGFGSFFIARRLHHHVNWYTPWLFATFTIILIGTWLGRSYEFNWHDRHNDETSDAKKKLRLREPL